MNAKNAPTINPGTEINHTDVDTASDNRIPKTPEAIDAIISISVACFVAANVKGVGNDGISRFLWKLKRNKKGTDSPANQCR